MERDNTPSDFFRWVFIALGIVTFLSVGLYAIGSLAQMSAVSPEIMLYLKQTEAIRFLAYNVAGYTLIVIEKGEASISAQLRIMSCLHPVVPQLCHKTPQFRPFVASIQKPKHNC